MSKRWAIYFGDREFAQVVGDPRLTTILADTKEDAERRAQERGFGTNGAGVWAVDISETMP